MKLCTYTIYYIQYIYIYILYIFVYCIYRGMCISASILMDLSAFSLVGKTQVLIADSMNTKAKLIRHQATRASRASGDAKKTKGWRIMSPLVAWPGSRDKSGALLWGAGECDLCQTVSCTARLGLKMERWYWIVRKVSTCIYIYT